MIEYLHKEVVIECKDGEIIKGFVENFENDFETDSGQDEISISQTGKDYELILEKEEIKNIKII